MYRPLVLGQRPVYRVQNVTDGRLEDLVQGRFQKEFQIRGPGHCSSKNCGNKLLPSYYADCLKYPEKCGCERLCCRVRNKQSRGCRIKMTSVGKLCCAVKLQVYSAPVGVEWKQFFPLYC